METGVARRGGGPRQPPGGPAKPTPRSSFGASPPETMARDGPAGRPPAGLRLGDPAREQSEHLPLSAGPGPQGIAATERPPGRPVRRRAAPGPAGGGSGVGARGVVAVAVARRGGQQRHAGRPGTLHHLRSLHNRSLLKGGPLTERSGLPSTEPASTSSAFCPETSCYLLRSFRPVEIGDHNGIERRQTNVHGEVGLLA